MRVGTPGKKRRLVRAAVIAVLAACLLPATSLARKPIISYVEGAQLKLYDAETGKDLAPLPVPVHAQLRYAISLNGRYVLFTDAGKKLHLLDRQANAEVPLPGIDIYMNPGFLSVNNLGLIAFDDNANGPTVVYDSVAKAFRPTGLPANNGHRQPKLSSSFGLVTTCGPAAGCVVDLGSDSNPYMQGLAEMTDLGLPDDNNSDEEDPCIDGTAALAGWHKGVPNAAGQKDVFIFDRRTGGFLSLPGLNHPVDDDSFCVLDSAGDYIGHQRENVGFMLYSHASASFVPLPAKPFSSSMSANAIFSAPQCGGRFATLVGSASRDVLKGSKGPDVILALEGNDVVKAGKGKDLICGGKGKDKLNGGAGNDRILGEAGADSLTGGKGKDKLRGGKGRDREIQ